MEYEETMNLDIENIPSMSQQIWRSIYEVIHDDYFRAVKLFPTHFLDHCREKNEPQNIPNKVKAALENMDFGKVVMIRRRNFVV